ncbi:hypothetical protein JOC85_001236 [Bacillus mesophilus]|uniref:NERD domain-containing protein n=1 Tax=Bacillus mesophilus TaxID=1808955 RepID=A0A6M0Q6M2_9BACI|nr:nuclease-related domain-containing protein [Bacillus mesophilus]MBM7660464.1 hypothetical protein [Bacillus mesophilus]NEY71985.1 NERD domain-containing protein [Bacillus mesophilus]
MIAKKRNYPIRIKKLEALLRRLPKSHMKRGDIEEELAKSYAGFRGEQSMNYHFDYLDKKKYTIIHDLRLFDQNHYFQMDTLILSTRFLLIVEIKNIIGTLIFDKSFQQLIRSYNGKEDAFHNPLIQAKNHQKK